MTYTLAAYSTMIDDAVRTDAHVRALERTVKPGSVVVDLGAGSGFFTFEALRLGARHVHAIETSEALLVAERIARENGLAERVTFHRALSTKVTLPDRVDLVVADMRGSLPLLGPVVPALADARARFLKPEGVLIPSHDTVSCALVSAEKPFDEWTRVFGARSGALDVGAARRLLVNRLHGGDLDDTTSLSGGQPLFTIAYGVDAERHAGEATLVVEKPGTAHALHVWFDATLTEGIGYTTGRAPKGARATVYGSTFFPLEAPLTVDVGDRVHVKARADLVDEDIIWSWDTTCTAADGAVRARARQSSFFGRIVATDALDRQRTDVVPPRPKDADVDLFVLTHLGDGRTVYALARALVERFPERAFSMGEAVRRVLRAARRGED